MWLEPLMVQVTASKVGRMVGDIAGASQVAAVIEQGSASMSPTSSATEEAILGEESSQDLTQASGDLEA
jgi:hypothetical protein